MKFLKLIILAAVIGGAVYLIKFIEIPDIIGDDEIDIARIEVLKPFIAEYTHEWENSPKWNQELYKKNLKEAELYRSADDISEAVYDKLRQNVNKDVLNRLVKLLEPDFRADPVPEATVEENMEGIAVVGEELPNDKLVKKMTAAWNTYKTIKAFVQKTYSGNSFALGMASDCSSWTSFDTHKRNETNKRDNYRNASLYKEYFADNSMLSKGLAAVPGNVEECRSGYNRRIVDAIKCEYGHVPTFNPGLYSSATDEEYDRAWNEFIEGFDTKSKKILAISSKFKADVDDSKLQREVSDIASKYIIVPTKPARPQQAN